MRRRLILMRHAKSSWKSDAPSDHTRPLNKRGRLAAPAVGRHLEQLGWKPDLILASDSVRTTETAQGLVGAFAAPATTQFLRELYHGGRQEIAEAIAAVDAAPGTILVLGHNPGWDAALTFYCGSHEGLKTADAALLEAESEDWAPLLAESDRFELITIVRARALEISASTEAEGAAGDAAAG